MGTQTNNLNGWNNFPNNPYESTIPPSNYAGTSKIDEMLEKIKKIQREEENLVYDPKTRGIRPARFTDDPDHVLHFNPSDEEFFCQADGKEATVVINLDAFKICALPKEEDTGSSFLDFIPHNDVNFFFWEEENVYTMFNPPGSAGSIPGTVLFWDMHDNFHIDTYISGISKETDRVVVVLEYKHEAQASNNGGVSFQFHGRCAWTRLNDRENSWISANVQIVEPAVQLGARHSGIFETSVLSNSRVFVIGSGGGGSQIADECAKAMVGRIDIMDPERIEPENLSRHIARLHDIGRHKTDVMRDLILSKNPNARVRAWKEEVCWENMEFVRQIVRENDVIVCATGHRPSRIILNLICAEEKKPLIMPSAFRRAYGGQIFYFPFNRESPCYQCLLNSLPDQENNQEVSSRRDADAVSYSDRRVPVEPGLSSDILTISLMCVKLVIQELLRGKPTNLRSLDDDLIAPWYIFFNRREPGLQSEKFTPLQFGVNGFRILRWYGIMLEKNPECPVCGDFTGRAAERLGISLSPNDIETFNQSGKQTKDS